MPGKTPFMKTICLFLFFLGNVLTAVAQVPRELQPLIAAFRKGYENRDTARAEAFVREVYTENVQLVGTGAGELFNGRADAGRLTRNDWLYWMDLRLAEDQARVLLQGNHAWIVLPGTTSITFPSKEAAYAFALGRVQGQAGAQPTDKDKLLMYARQAAEMVQEIESRGLTFSYAIRLVGSAVRGQNGWRFGQLTFSYPYPMVRQ